MVADMTTRQLVDVACEHLDAGRRVRAKFYAMSAIGRLNASTTEEMMSKRADVLVAEALLALEEKK